MILIDASSVPSVLPPILLIMYIFQTNWCTRRNATRPSPRSSIPPSKSSPDTNSSSSWPFLLFHAYLYFHHPTLSTLSLFKSQPSEWTFPIKAPLRSVFRFYLFCTNSPLEEEKLKRYSLGTAHSFFAFPFINSFFSYFMCKCASKLKARAGSFFG